jgi:hypothetical protein
MCAFRLYRFQTTEQISNVTFEHEMKPDNIMALLQIEMAKLSGTDQPTSPGADICIRQ